MFQFPRLPPEPHGPGALINSRAGFPIRESPAKPARRLTGAYRSLATPFFGSQRQGIPREPVVACGSPRIRYSDSENAESIILF